VEDKFMAEDFTTNMMRMLCGTLYFSASMQASREMYGRSYFSLGVGERAALDQVVLASVAANFQNVTPEKLASHSTAKPAGFQFEAAPEDETP
jgi:hypothetical protein